MMEKTTTKCELNKQKPATNTARKPWAPILPPRRSAAAAAAAAAAACSSWHSSSRGVRAAEKSKNFRAKFFLWSVQPAGSSRGCQQLQLLLLLELLQSVLLSA